MTVAEIAAVLKLNQQTIRNWIEQADYRPSRSDAAYGSNAPTSSSCSPPPRDPQRRPASPPAYTAERYLDAEPHPPPALAC